MSCETVERSNRHVNVGELEFLDHTPEVLVHTTIPRELQFSICVNVTLPKMFLRSGRLRTNLSMLKDSYQRVKCEGE